jgi:hypothetical protein
MMIGETSPPTLIDPLALGYFDLLSIETLRCVGEQLRKQGGEPHSLAVPQIEAEIVLAREPDRLSGTHSNFLSVLKAQSFAWCEEPRTRLILGQ